MATSAAPLVASADQLANDQAEAQYLANRIATVGMQESALGEQYDNAMATLAAANGRVAAASRALAHAHRAQATTVTLLQQDAIDAYVGGGPQAALSGSLPAQDPNDALLRQEMAQTFASQQSDALDSYQEAADNYTTARQALEAARNSDARQLARLDKSRQQVQAAEDQLISLQSQVKGQIATLVYQIQQAKMAAEQRAEAALLAQEQAQAAAAAQAQAQAQAQAEAQQEAQARQEQAAAEAAAATTTTQPSNQSADYVPTPATPQIPGVSAAASIAVSAALSRVGDPYVWGAAGPDEFDCSGLVMWAYAQAGVYLDHYSGAQFSETVQIPMSDLEPGDLVFPADPGEHVAMYIGNGEIVQAPYTGANVQVVPLDSFFVYATRVE